MSMLIQLAYLHGKIWKAPKIDVEEVANTADQEARLRILTLLEIGALERRTELG